MPSWPFTHNWTATYNQTWSFNTTILTSQSGREQRIAERAEPRRSVTTVVLEDAATARTLDRFLWSQQASLFDYIDPTNGVVSQVRFDDAQTIAHPGAHVAVATINLSVEPGTGVPPLPGLVPGSAYVDAEYFVDDYVVQEVPSVRLRVSDASYTFGGRYVFPFPVNWTSGRSDAFTIPRRIADFGRGVIAVSRPINFATRTGSVTLLRVGQGDTDALVDFFSAMRGRQGEFWSESLLDDFEVLEIVSNTLEVAGADAAAMYAADPVNAGVALHSYSGGVYRRRVLSAVVSGDTTFLQLDYDVPEQPVRWQRCSWMQLSRFASDDLTVQWTTSTVAQSQVQVQSLPYAPVEASLQIDPLSDYFGALFYPFSDGLDYIVNTEAPLYTGDYIVYYGFLTSTFADPLDYMVNEATPRADQWSPYKGMN